MIKTIVHADDYAISRHVSESIADLIKEGAIQSISVMPNMESTEYGVMLLKPFADRVFVSVHLNLVEGRCVAEPGNIPMLVDKNGFFKLSWIQLMFKSVSLEFRRQVAIELRTQLLRGKTLFSEVGFTGRLRIDSHQHTHMIPGIFRTVCGLAGEFNAEYIRLTREPLTPYIKAVNLWKTYYAVDVIKNVLLNIFSLADRKMLKRIQLEYHYFFGLLLTGKMDYRRVTEILPLMPDERPIEVVLHAGRMLESEITKEYNKKDFIKEHVSNYRLLEIETAQRLKI